MGLPNIFPPEIFVIPKELNLLVVIGLAFACIVEMRKGYIGRPGIVANSLFVIEIMGPHWDRLWVLAQLYLYGAVIVGIVAGLSYLSKRSLSSDFYRFCFIAYGSFSLLLMFILMYNKVIPMY